MASGKSRYEQVVQKRGQPLREGFTIVKVHATVSHAYLPRSPNCVAAASHLGDCISEIQSFASPSA